MPVSILSISYKEAAFIVERIVERAASDAGGPVAVAVVDVSARLVCFAAMDFVMPASIQLSQAKAYSAVVGQRDTEFWANKPKHPTVVDFDMRNWADRKFIGFAGGIAIRNSSGVIGGIGVSGRKGVMSDSDTHIQDSELARFGQTSFSEYFGACER